MRKSKFTEEQIVGILRETDRDPVPTVAKRHGVSEQSIYTWKKRFGTFQPDDVRLVCPLQRYQSVSHSPAGLASPWADRRVA